MDSTILTAIIAALATVIAAFIRANRNSKANTTKEKEAKNLYKGISTIPFNMEVIVPTEFDKVPQTFGVTGICDTLPQKYTIWVATVGVWEENRDNVVKKVKHYWPQTQAEIITKIPDGKIKWKGKVNWLGGTIQNEIKEFTILIAGESGKVLFEYYINAGKEANKWVPITELTKDIIEMPTTCKVVFDPPKDS